MLDVDFLAEIAWLLNEPFLLHQYVVVVALFVLVQSGAEKAVMVESGNAISPLVLELECLALLA